MCNWVYKPTYKCSKPEKKNSGHFLHSKLKAMAQKYFADLEFLLKMFHRKREIRRRKSLRLKSSSGNNILETGEKMVYCTRCDLKMTISKLK